MARDLAASFTDRRSAEAALVALTAILPLGTGQVAVAPLGHATYPAPSGSILAGRFDEADVDAVYEIVARFGGTMVAEVVVAG